MAESWIEIAHARAGELNVREDTLIHFPGLPGFPNARRFTLVQAGLDPAFRWLACLDDPELAFVVTDPQLFFPDYSPALSVTQLRALGASLSDELVVLAIANFAAEQPSLNLAAPLLIHTTTRCGAQIVLDGPNFPLAERLPTHDPVGDPAAMSQIESKPQT